MENDFLIGAFTNAGLFFVGWAMKKIGPFFSKKDPRFKSSTFFLFCLIWLIGSGFLFNKAIYDNEASTLYFIFFIIFSVIFCVIIWKDLSQFWYIGILGVDRKIDTGVDFDKSLLLCKNQLAFLGIGASKLTKSPEFEKAMFRCRQDRPIKFLLCKPSDEYLISAAKRANQAEDKYKDVVIASLKTIADLKLNRKLNIEVRFYSEKPLFRLMFIDDAICLLSSYAKFGVSDGSEVPQLHLKNMTGSDYSISLFSPMEQYFNWLWNVSEDWDFKNYLA